MKEVVILCRTWESAVNTYLKYKNKMPWIWLKCYKKGHQIYLISKWGTKYRFISENESAMYCRGLNADIVTIDTFADILKNLKNDVQNSI